MLSSRHDLIDAAGTRHQPAGAGARIVCLVPSITELLFDLRLQDHIVGRTGFCFHPKQAVRQVTKVGGTKDFDVEQIRALSPTHLIVNVDENPLARVEAVGKFVPNLVVTHPMGPLDNVELYRLLGAIFGREKRSEQLVTRFQAAYQQAVEATRGLARERVLYVIWKNPWMTISPDTYIARTLAAIGWDHIEVPDAGRYPEIELAPLLGAVDRVLLSSEPYAFRPRDVAAVNAMRERDDRPAVCLIDAEMTSWYGSRAITGMQYLASLRTASPS